MRSSNVYRNMLKLVNIWKPYSYEYLLQKQSQERHDGTIASEQKSLRFRLTGRCRAAERENIWLSILGPQKVQHWNCFECCSPERLWQGQVLETAVTIRGECHPQRCLKWVSLVGDTILRTLGTCITVQPKHRICCMRSKAVIHCPPAHMVSLPWELARAVCAYLLDVLDTSQAFLTSTYCSIVAVTCAKRVEYMLSIFEFPAMA